MLAMGRALTVRPRLLMVDEMSLGLAPIIVERLLPVLRSDRRRRPAPACWWSSSTSTWRSRWPTVPTCCPTANLALEGSAAELSANRHLLESSYLGQSEIAAAEEEQEETRRAERVAPADAAAPPSGVTSSHTSMPSFSARRIFLPS